MELPRSYEKNYIYIITHHAFPGWIKVGKTRSPKERLSQYQIGCPDRAYKIDYIVAVDDPNKVESYFKCYVPSNGSEWFNCTLSDGIATIHQAINPTKFSAQGPVIKLKNSGKFVYNMNGSPFTYSLETISNKIGIAIKDLCFSQSKDGIAICVVGELTIKRMTI